MSHDKTKDYTIPDLMREFNAGRDTIKTLLQKGELCGYLLNGRWRVEASEVQDYKRRNVPIVADSLTIRIPRFRNMEFAKCTYKPGDRLV